MRNPCALATEDPVFSVAFLLALLSAAGGNFSGSEEGFEVAFRGQHCVCCKFLPIGLLHNFNTVFSDASAPSHCEKGDIGLVHVIDKRNSCFPVLLFPARYVIDFC